MEVVDVIHDLPIHPTRRYATRPLAAIERLVLHHAASAEDATPFDIARFHVETRGWPGVAYHYLVAVDGTVYKCHLASTVSYCVAHGNTKSLCICLIGNRDTLPPSVQQLDAALQLLRDLIAAYHVGLVYGHREVPTDPPQATACPGRYIDMDGVRAAVGGRIA